jgi:hypothetical protein
MPHGPTAGNWLAGSAVSDTLPQGRDKAAPAAKAGPSSSERVASAFLRSLSISASLWPLRCLAALSDRLSDNEVDRQLGRTDSEDAQMR